MYKTSAKCVHKCFAHFAVKCGLGHANVSLIVFFLNPLYSCLKGSSQVFIGGRVVVFKMLRQCSHFRRVRFLMQNAGIVVQLISFVFICDGHIRIIGVMRVCVL